MVTSENAVFFLQNCNYTLLDVLMITRFEYGYIFLHKTIKFCGQKILRQNYEKLN